MNNIVLKLTNTKYTCYNYLNIQIGGGIITILLSIIIFLLGLIIVFIFKNKNKDRSFAIIILTTSLLLITNSFGTTWNSIIQLIATLRSSETIENISQIDEIFSQPQFLQLIIGIVLFITALILELYSRNKIFILNINGYLENSIEKQHKQLGLNNFEFKEREIDLIRIYNNNKIQNVYQEILKVIEEKTKTFSQESSHFKKGYTGIAPIPFIMWAGSNLKRVKLDEYYEFDKFNSQKFYQLKKGNKKYPRLNTSKREINSNPRDIVISVSITSKIKKEQLKQFDNSNIIEFSIDNPRDNAIQFKNQLTAYTSEIITSIEEVPSSVQRVHLVIASQSSLILEIGKLIDEQRMPEIISYHFDRQQNPMYPWGIIMNGKNKGELQY